MAPKAKPRKKPSDVDGVARAKPSVYIPPVPVPCNKPEVASVDGSYARVRIADTASAFPMLGTSMPMTFVYKYGTYNRTEGVGQNMIKIPTEGWWPWVVIAESTILKYRFNEPGQYGLYAWRPFHGQRPPRVGIIEMGDAPEVLGNYKEDAEQIPAMIGYSAEYTNEDGSAMEQPIDGGSDDRTKFPVSMKAAVQAALVTRVRKDKARWTKLFLLNESHTSSDFSVWNGNTPTHIWSFANQVKNPNMEVSRSGTIQMQANSKVTRGIQLDKPLSDNTAAELTLDYGKEFWKIHGENGQPPKKIQRKEANGGGLPDAVNAPAVLQFDGMHIEDLDDLDDLDTSASPAHSIVDATVGAYLRKAYASLALG